MWIDAWTGIPHRKLGRGPEYDCLGLFLALHRARFGRDLPDPGVTMLRAARERTADQMRPLFRRVEEPEEGDALVFRVRDQLLHVGYALGGREMLHMDEGAKLSRVERWDYAQWRSRLEGIYRWIG